MHARKNFIRNVEKKSKTFPMASFGSSCHGNGKRYNKIVGRLQTVILLRNSMEKNSIQIGHNIKKKVITLGVVLFGPFKIGH